MLCFAQNLAYCIHILYVLQVFLARLNECNEALRNDTPERDCAMDLVERTEPLCKMFWDHRHLLPSFGKSGSLPFLDASFKVAMLLTNLDSSIS